jgi:hypothetical protein
MKLITTAKPPLNLFEVVRKQFSYSATDWTTVYEVPAYKVPKSAIEPTRLIDIACIMTGVLVTNPGTIGNGDGDIEVSVKIETQKDFNEYATVPTSGSWSLGDVVRVGRSLYVYKTVGLDNAFEKFLDEFAEPGATYDVNTANPKVNLAAASEGEVYFDGSNIMYKYDASNGTLLRTRYTLVNNFVIQPNDFALISLERQVMKSGDRLLIQCNTDQVKPAVVHFSFILNQREEFTKVIL